jgi:multimeric flavodoxin WrbA
MKYIIIYGSSGGADGQTWKLTQSLSQTLQAEIINLSDYNISFFDYSHQNQNDDFKILIEKVLSIDCIIFVTPVYWYAMSAQLKVFFDRLNDLTTLRKTWGRQLKGKSIAFLATGIQATLPMGFEIPFKGTAEYFDMNFKGHVYICIDSQQTSKVINEQRLMNFVKLIQKL